jgi:hypothetical protein
MAHSHQVWIVNQDKETGKIEKKSLEAVCHNKSKSAEQKAHSQSDAKKRNSIAGIGNCDRPFG